MAKVIACRCEDVTVSDIERAIGQGYIDIEEIKRTTGFGTGPCQGKECLRGVAALVAERTGTVPTSIMPFTTRPPLLPTPIRLLAQGMTNVETVDTRIAEHAGESPRAIRETPLPATAEFVVVGAGVMGLGIAYYLTQYGGTDVVILDKGYLASGASGRNGGGVRQQWSTETNIRLMRESVTLCRNFAQETGVNVWFRPGGYLFLLRTEAETQRLERNVILQNRLGIPTHILSPSEAHRLVPHLDLRGFHAACFNPTDGILFPWPFLWGYAQAAQRRGARLFTHTEVIGLERHVHGYKVHTPQGTIVARRVINAAGAWSPQLTAFLGVPLPTFPVRHEICSSEPLKPFLKPMVSVLSSGLYFSQSMRGELVGGITLPGEPPTLAMGSRLKFLSAYTQGLSELMPHLTDLKILRQWAGPYDISPDGNPLLGEVPGYPGFYLCCGFMGHGFMMAPVVSKYYAEWLAGGRRHDMFDRFSLARFAGSAPAVIEREDFIIG